MSDHIIDTMAEQSDALANAVAKETEREALDRAEKALEGGGQ